MSMKRALERKARHAFVLKDYKRTIALLNELLREVGENPHTLHMLARCSEYLGDDAGARDYAARALEVEPSHFGSLQVMTQASYKLDAADDARAFARRALSHLPRYQPRIFSLAWLADRLGDSPPGGAEQRLAPEDQNWVDWVNEHVLVDPESGEGL